MVSVDFYPNPAEGSSGAKRVGLGPLPVDIGEGTPEGGLQSRNLGMSHLTARVFFFF